MAIMFKRMIGLEEWEQEPLGTVESADLSAMRLMFSLLVDPPLIYRMKIKRQEDEKDSHSISGFPTFSIASLNNVVLFFCLRPAYKESDEMLGSCLLVVQG
jgi:hypothetical protein